MKKPPPRPNNWLHFSHLLPRKWGRIGHPIPVPGGFVFIVSLTVMGRRRYALNRWSGAAAFTPVTDDMGRALVLPDAQTARRVLQERATKIEEDEE